MSDQIHFLKSLSADDEAIAPYLPYLLQDLWSLGSVPQYVFDIIEHNIPTDQIQTVTDLGCGKGEILIQLRKKFAFTGTGIDIVPEFIEEAQAYSNTWGVTNSLQFEAADIVTFLGELSEVDLLIYGHDSELFGTLKESINTLSDLVRPKCWMIVESVYATSENSEYPDKGNFFSQIEQSKMTLIDHINWDLRRIKNMNAFHLEKITNRIQELISKYPENQPIFNQYLNDQKKECSELENDLQCVTLLLERND